MTPRGPVQEARGVDAGLVSKGVALWLCSIVFVFCPRHCPSDVPALLFSSPKHCTSCAPSGFCERLRVQLRVPLLFSCPRHCPSSALLCWCQKHYISAVLPLYSWRRSCPSAVLRGCFRVQNTALRLLHQFFCQRHRLSIVLPLLSCRRHCLSVVILRLFSCRRHRLSAVLPRFSCPKHCRPGCGLSIS